MSADETATILGGRKMDAQPHYLDRRGVPGLETSSCWLPSRQARPPRSPDRASATRAHRALSRPSSPGVPQQMLAPLGLAAELIANGDYLLSVLHAGNERAGEQAIRPCRDFAPPCRWSATITHCVVEQL